MIQDLQHVTQRNCSIKQEPRRATYPEGVTVRKPRLSTPKEDLLHGKQIVLLAVETDLYNFSRLH